jgi:hypothetical protein
MADSYFRDRKMKPLEAPVALIVFNRPETTRRVFAAVAAARPARLLLIADGPRGDRAGESERCDEVRKIVTTVDWPCEVLTNFAAENMGCRRRVISGLNWVFSQVEEAIILEDDCLPDASFFPFCAEMLELYRHNCQIGIVAGFNFLEEGLPFDHSYFFTSAVPIWGWATWRRSWQKYDEDLKGWPEVKQDGVLNQLLPNEKMANYWAKIFDSMYNGTGPNTWDYQLTYTSWTRNWLNILPVKNLVENIGFGKDATHTTAANPIAAIRAKSLEFPLKHPPAITPWAEHTLKFHARFFEPALTERISRKVNKLLGRHT